MPKSSRKQIDVDEKNVIKELQINSNESIDKIAKKCGFSRQKVWRIIKRLEKNKTIWGYTAIADEEKRDLNHYILLVKRTNIPITEELADIIISRKLEKLVPNASIRVENSLYVHGVYDWILSFTARDIKQAKIFCEIFNSTYQGYIAELNLLETMFPVVKQGVLNPDVKRIKEFL